jgi:site-specific recombinase XerD
VARLGLRSIEVARLELGDVDQHRGQLVIRSRARRRDRLPLTVEVGKALAAHLPDARPRTQCRRLFVTCRAPGRSIRADLVGDVVKRACRRAGLSTVGSHRLRHALATELLSKGVMLTEISQVLRHRDLATTAIYVKVGLISLRAVAQPWPDAVRAARGNGMLVGEAIRLDVSDIDWDQGVLLVRQSKSGKSRMVPHGAARCRCNRACSPR